MSNAHVEDTGEPVTEGSGPLIDPATMRPADEREAARTAFEREVGPPLRPHKPLSETWVTMFRRQSEGRDAAEWLAEFCKEIFENSSAMAFVGEGEYSPMVFNAAAEWSLWEGDDEKWTLREEVHAANAALIDPLPPDDVDDLLAATVNACIAECIAEDDRQRTKDRVISAGKGYAPGAGPHGSGGPRRPKWRAGRKIAFWNDLRDWMIATDGLGSSARWVCWILSTYADPMRMRANPSLETLQKATGLTRRTLIAATDELQDWGIIHKTPGKRGRGSSSTYQFLDDGEWAKGAGSPAQHVIGVRE